MQYAYGVTTVPQRIDDLLPRTLDSLRNAGFPRPRLFIDGRCRAAEYAHFNLDLTIHDPPLGIMGNWLVSLWELFIREPRAQRYIIFQDDLLAYAGLREYLDRTRLPAHGFFNLYTSGVNRKLCPPAHVGWYKSDQLGRGAVGLMFDFKALSRLLSAPYLVSAINSPVKRHTYHDACIARAMKDCDVTEYVHSPSLLGHSGGGPGVSTWKDRDPCDADFRGEDFDAMELLAEVTPL